MDDARREKITRFLNDRIMSDAVYEVLFDAFMKPVAGDVNTLAASRIAIDMMRQAWRDLEKLKNEEPKEPKTLNQVGL